MICTEILGNISGIHTDKTVHCVSVEWFERDKKILRKVLESGEEIGIRCVQKLSEGDILFEDDKNIIAVSIAPCDLISTPVRNMREMGRLCFELGNRHLTLAISDDNVRCPYDEPTFAYLQKLGFSSEKVHERFDDYIECRAHGHSNEHGHSHHHHE
ncbi:MAG: urease accessory protein UreE [Oscillospiraceae bacterium]|nr:urease accessory protein UreE [Oscillospiraceae bacterium]